jgi:hypothetical protein
MTRELPEAMIPPEKAQSLARSFYYLGWAGFWLQLFFGSLPLFGLAYYFIFTTRNPDAEDGWGLMEFLTLISLLILMFTTWWSFGYTRIARRLRDPQTSVSEPYLNRTVWIGVAATSVGMLLSMLAIVIETAGLLFYFMKSPQAGVPVIQTSGVSGTHWVSTFDMMSLMALILFLFAEQLVLVFGLWLLFRTTVETPASQPAPAPVPAEAPVQETQESHQTPG